MYTSDVRTTNIKYMLQKKKNFWRGGSNEYPQSMFWAEIREVMYTPVNLSFTK